MFEIRKSAGGEVSGPYSSRDIKQLAHDGRLEIEDEIRSFPDGNWQSVKKVKGLTFASPEAGKAVTDVILRPRPPQLPAESVGKIPQPILYSAPAAAPPLPDPEVVLCNFCNEVIKAGARKCKHCGEILDPLLRQSAAATAPPVNIVNQTTVVNAVGASPVPRWNAGVAALLSFILPGLGQLYKGQVFNGIAWFFMTMLGYLAFVIPGVVLHVCCIVGATTGDPYR